jgi:hypothetical protein
LDKLSTFMLKKFSDFEYQVSLLVFCVLNFKIIAW